MPPRFPHRLRRPPTEMSKFEVGVFGLLAGSVGVGLYQLATSPWREQEDYDKSALQEDAFSKCPMKKRKATEEGGKNRRGGHSNGTSLETQIDDKTKVQLGR
mmetsp:Transcript_8885/g.26620  ORF Transcript_8885/g.26620 Transcript_8885/m.26620 type:complete len:102 (-) Transcript_8885:73-378(-)|eukprot:CAMPEP_0113526348 /NCGR_PEP_ID=MMETSP0015_2-20120614/687_1 /TAXON_ID=2838 /ORGANISM="Odontella" /LENGTH=101 /DNA_ID=CAMNT_0000424655 /DNA_START=234 /DNA_END=539 /DNA_ORIENTATION=+ /assembly_acc=CAM_ASM_000160